MMLYSFGDYTLDAEHYELRQAGRLVRLEPRVFNLLAYLVQHAGRLVTNKELKEQLWPKRQVVGESSLSNAVAQARKTLADTGQVQRYIQTVHRRGYRFVAPVTARPPGVMAPLAPDPSASTSASMPAPPLVPLADAPTPATPSAAMGGTPDDEWRPLTVLACQLVGVSSPTPPHDREARLAVVRDCQVMATEVIQRFDGHLTQSQGEQLLVYFGYPRAHEDDARRAVLAGLGIVDGMIALNSHRPHDSGVRLAVQVGIHTGVELVGAVGRSDPRAPLVGGETPAIAAGLQRLAEPDTVVISSATWRVVEGYVVGEVLGAHRFDPLAEPLTAYRVLQERPAHTRLGVAIARGLTPFVGREPELGLLHECWAQAAEGSGQVVVLRGEAGIGKSRLVQVFTEQLTGEMYTRLEFHCSPYYRHTALYPLVTSLQRLLRFRPGESADERLRTLEGLLEESGVALAEGLPLWAALLSLPLPAGYPPLTLTPESQRRKTFETLLMWLLTAAERQPVCVLVEDLHWADASTLEWLTLLIDQAPTARLLLLLVCRAEFPQPWAARAHLSQVTLRRLSRPHVETMVQRLTASKALPVEVLRCLVAATDGVPLFVEELTKTVLESGLVHERGGRYELAGPLPALAIPATLHDSLMARLD
jgi:DNA-binding winged helix-turn-helix (wHTH) protein